MLVLYVWRSPPLHRSLSLAAVVDFVNRFLTLVNHSIGGCLRLCINAQLLVIVAENGCGSIRSRGCGILMRYPARIPKSSAHGACATSAAFCARLCFHAATASY